ASTAAVGLGDGRPHNVARRAGEYVAADRSTKVRRLVGHAVLDLGAALDHAAEERSAVDGDRTDWHCGLAALRGEAHDEAGDINVGEHHVRRAEVIARD